MPRLLNAHANTQPWLKCVNPRRTTKSLRTTNTITRVTFNYGRIITADDEGVILVFSNEGQLKMRLKGHKHGVWCLASTKTKLISGSEDKTIRVWNLLTGHCTHVFRGHTGVVRALVILQPELPLDPEPGQNPDEPSRSQPIRSLIVSGSRDGSVRVWMLPRATEAEYGRYHKGAPPPDPDPNNNPYHLYHLTGHNGSVRCVAANRKIVLSGGDDGDVRAYDVKAGGVLLYLLQGHTAKVTNVTIDPRLRIWYSASFDGTIRLWDAKNGECMKVGSVHTGPITYMFNSPWRLYTAAEDGFALTWGASSGDVLRSFHSADGSYVVDFGGDDYKVLTVTESSAKFWFPQDGRLVRTLYQCAEGEKLSHISYEFQQCAITYKDAQGVNTLLVIDFRPPETINEQLYPPANAIDSEEESIEERRYDDSD